MPVRRKGERWYAYSKDPDGKQRSHGGFRTKRDAERALRTVLKARDDGKYVEPSRQSVEALFDDWLTRKLADGTHRPRTSDYYRETLRLYVVPTIGHLRVGEVRPHHIQAVVDAMRAGKRGPAAASSVHRRYRMVRACFASAVARGDIGTNPCRGIALPKDNGGKVQPPDIENVRSIIDVAAAPYRLPLALLAYCGLRRGEALGLRWSDVDLIRGCLFVRQAATYTAASREVTFATPKSRDSERPVPLAPSMVAILRAAKVEQAERLLALGIREPVLVVDNGDGTPMHPERLSRYFREHVQALGIGCRLHDLRHAAVTAMLAGGVDLALVSAVAGHSSVSFTARTYGHLQPEHLRAAGDAMERALAGVGAS